MNYLAHSLPFVFHDDALAAWRVAGTALPDWLRALDKHARLRPAVLARAPDDDPRFVALRDGAQRHHDDDLRFHACDAFDALAADTAAAIRAGHPHLRASALGHVVVEMLLDAALIEAHPTLLPRFYEALDAVDDAVVASFARRATGRPLPHAEIFLDRFRRTRFLHAYIDDAGLLDCLRGTWRRAGLGSIDDAVIDVIVAARPRARALLAFLP